MPLETKQAARLRDRALRHLARFPASSTRLRGVLERYARKLAAAGDLEPAAAGPLIEAVVQGLVEQGLLDDRSYARGRARALARRGRSRARIRGALGVDGIDRDLAEEALDQALADADDGEQALAVRYARRRGLGPFRAAADRAPRRERDLRSLVRQGFPLPVARAVIDAEAPDAIDDPLA